MHAAPHSFQQSLGAQHLHAQEMQEDAALHVIVIEAKIASPDVFDDRRDAAFQPGMVVFLGVDDLAVEKSLDRLARRPFRGHGHLQIGVDRKHRDEVQERLTSVGWGSPNDGSHELQIRRRQALQLVKIALDRDAVDVGREDPAVLQAQNLIVRRPGAEIGFPDVMLPAFFHDALPASYRKIYAPAFVTPSRRGTTAGSAYQPRTLDRLYEVLAECHALWAQVIAPAIKQENISQNIKD